MIHLINNKITNKPIKPFDNEVIDFLDSFSKELKKESLSAKFPDILTFAFWIRKANIKNLAKEYCVKDRIGWGVAFHIAPSNVPINFIFSYVLGLLSGNCNIVRVPSKYFPQVDIVLKVLKKVLKEYPKISNMSHFLSYERDNLITTNLSNSANVRVIWGGDSTIYNIKQLQTKPRLVDIVFADRYSVCIMDSDKLNDYELIAKRFYNDTYLMDQNGCSSPHLILWINKNKEKINKFYQALYEVAKQEYNLADVIAIDKFNQSCYDAVNLENITLKTYENLLYVVTINNKLDSVDKLRGIGGYFYEYYLQDLAQFSKIANDKFQTVTYYGIEAKEIEKIIYEYNLNGIDKIVPIGNAFNMDVIWDGYEIIYNMSRKIKVI